MRALFSLPKKKIRNIFRNLERTELPDFPTRASYTNYDLSRGYIQKPAPHVRQARTQTVQKTHAARAQTSIAHNGNPIQIRARARETHTHIHRAPIRHIPPAWEGRGIEKTAKARIIRASIRAHTHKRGKKKRNA